MTFLGGPHGCIGYQFTVVEFVHHHLHSPMSVPNHFDPRRMKCLLFALIRKFEFQLALPAEDIVWWNQAVVRRPLVKGPDRDQRGLPLYVKIHVPDA